MSTTANILCNNWIKTCPLYRHFKINEHVETQKVTIAGFILTYRLDLGLFLTQRIFRYFSKIFSFGVRFFEAILLDFKYYLNSYSLSGDTVTLILCQAVDNTPRRFHMGATFSGWLLYDESIALQQTSTASRFLTGMVASQSVQPQAFPSDCSDFLRSAICHVSPCKCKYK